MEDSLLNEPMFAVEVDSLWVMLAEEIECVYDRVSVAE